MFPTVRVSFSGLMRPSKPSDFYAVLLDIVPVDSRRYRYAYHRSAWLVAGKADPPPPPRLHAHPDTPFTFEALTKQVISFEKAKLTNNEMDRNGQVSLTAHSTIMLFFFQNLNLKQFMILFRSSSDRLFQTGRKKNPFVSVSIHHNKFLSSFVCSFLV